MAVDAFDATAPAWLAADWPAPAGVRALTTLRCGAGASRAPFDRFNLGNCASVDGDDPRTVAGNRAELAALARLPSPPRWLRQVHGTAVARFDEAMAGDAGIDARDDPPQADAAVTSRRGVVLAILTADCLPVVFAAADGGEVAAAHAGWRGLADGVLENTLTAMHAGAAEVIAWLGPAAGPADYEVGEDVFAAFTAHDRRALPAFVATRPGHWRVDLYALARLRLVDAGVSRVHGGGLSTIGDPARFFSHRRDRRSGRMATLVWMAPDRGDRDDRDDGQPRR